VLNRTERRASKRRGGIAIGVFGVCVLAAAALLAGAAAPDQPASDSVGVIEGADITISGPMSVEMVGGQVKTVLRSGSDVRVKSGQARVNLVESGQISICGPAHFSVLKSAGALTLALESGIVHMRLDTVPAVTVYTAQIQAQPIGIGDDPRDFLIGFETQGAMCIRTYRGAMRLEQQLTGQNVMVPQGGDILLTSGQIESLKNGAGHCRCELEIAKAAHAPVVPAPVASTPAIVTSKGGSSAAQDAGPEPAASEKPATKDEPVYQVSLPPLRYDATAKVQPEPDPKLMVIVRKVRVRPTLIFQGKVEGEPPVAVAAVASASPAATAAPTNTPPPQESVVDRVRSFFRKLWTRGG
jgi:hypothetical protein